MARILHLLPIVFLAFPLMGQKAGREPKAKEPELVFRHAHSRTVSSVIYSPDGKTLAAGVWDGTIRLWDTSGGARPRIFKHSKVSKFQFVFVSFSPDGGTIASGSWEDGKVRLRRVSDGALLRVLLHHGPVSSVTFSPDGGTIAAGPGTER